MTSGMSVTIRGRMIGVLIALGVLGGIRPGQAAEQPSIAWRSDVSAAWKATQEQGRPLLVFVTAKQCGFCVKMKQSTFTDPQVASTINRSFVPLVLDGDSASPLVKDLGVTAFPATFVISREAVILDRVNGYVPPKVLISRLTAIQTSEQTASRPEVRGREY